MMITRDSAMGRAQRAPTNNTAAISVGMGVRRP